MPRFLRLGQALDSISPYERADFFNLPPPNNDELTDEEFINEDILDNYELPDDFSSEIEVFQPSQMDSEITKKINSDWRSIRPNFHPDLRKDHLDQQIHFDRINENLLSTIQGMTPMEVFSLFLDDIFLQEIVNKSISYAAKKGESLEMTVGCLKRFIGILFFSGFHTLPQEQSYWSTNPVEGVEFVKNSMPRNRFWTIKKSIHFEDEIPNRKDRSSRIRPFFTHLNDKFKQFGYFAESLSIDEMMVSYFGGHPFKQFIRGKPIRFGFKLWALCESKTGFCFSFELYEGRRTEKCEFGLGESVVLNFVEEVENNDKHKFYFDNFFTSIRLMRALKNQNVRATGTVRRNRTNNCPISDTFSKKRCPKNFTESHFDSKNQILCTIWKDNAIVKLLTNHEEAEPVLHVQRRHSTVKIPSNIQQYTNNMGGVDRHDSKANSYRIRIRGKKWYWPLFTQGLNMAMVNAFILYSMCNQKMSFYEFLTEITVQLMNAPTHLSEPKKRFDFRIRDRNPDFVDLQSHFLVKIPGGRQMRCRQCKKNSRFQCKACKVGQHIECFPIFHQQI